MGKTCKNAARGYVPNTDLTIIMLTLALIKKTGLLVTTTEKFCLQNFTNGLLH
jgi:hypothetical protein